MRLAKLAFSAALAALTVSLVAAALYLYLVQDKLVFFPTSVDRASIEAISREVGAQPIVVSTDEGQLVGALFPAKSAGPAPTVIYFPGNAESVWHSAHRMRWLQELGFNLAFASYRGYDQSQGAPSADALLLDSVRLFDAVVASDRVDPARVVSWGFSLGTGPAAFLAAKRPVSRLILAAPYDRLSNVASHHFPFVPISLIFRHEIRSIDFAREVKAPTLIVHGARDEVIPAELSTSLAAAYSGLVRRVEIPNAGHNDLPLSGQFNSLVMDFLR